MNRLAPDLRERLAQQVPTSLTQTDPSTLLPPVNTAPPSGGGYVPFAPPGTTMNVMVTQAGQGQGPVAPTSPGAPAYKNINDVPLVEWSTYKPKPHGERARGGQEGRNWFQRLFDRGGIAGETNKALTQERDAADLALRVGSRQRFLQDRLDRYDTIAKMAGTSPEERKAQQDMIRYALKNGTVDPATGEAIDPRKMTDEEWSAFVESQVAAAEDPLVELVFSNQAQGIVPGQQAQQLQQPGTWTPEQIMALQAQSVRLLQPALDILNRTGQSDLAAAYRLQAMNMPTVAQAQMAERYYQDLQTANNQLLSYQQGGGGGGQYSADQLAALIAGG